MLTYLYIILAYLLVLTVVNFIRSKRIKSQEDFMVAGRGLKTSVMVFTLTSLLQPASLPCGWRPELG